VVVSVIVLSRSWFALDDAVNADVDVRLDVPHRGVAGEDAGSRNEDVQQRVDSVVDGFRERDEILRVDLPVGPEEPRNGCPEVEFV
jgi:hypothetical protein